MWLFFIYLQVQKQNVCFAIDRLYFLIAVETLMDVLMHFYQLGKLPVPLYCKRSNNANFSLTLLLSY